MRVATPEPLASLTHWRAADDVARQDALESVAETLGPSYQLMGLTSGREGFGALRYEEADATFIVVPGCEFEMGLRAGDLACLVEVVERLAAAEWGDLESAVAELPAKSVAEYFTASWRDELCRMRPPLSVRVPPFLAARQLVFGSWPDSWRLPTESEWELIASEGGERRLLAEVEGHSVDPDAVNAWGFHNLAGPPEPVSDPWWPDHAHRDRDGRVPAGERKQTMRGLTHEWQDLSEAIQLLVAWRTPLDPYAVVGRRPVIGLKFAPSGLGSG